MDNRCLGPKIRYSSSWDAINPTGWEDEITYSKCTRQDLTDVGKWKKGLESAAIVLAHIWIESRFENKPLFGPGAKKWEEIFSLCVKERNPRYTEYQSSTTNQQQTSAPPKYICAQTKWSKKCSHGTECRLFKKWKNDQKEESKGDNGAKRKNNKPVSKNYHFICSCGYRASKGLKCYADHLDDCVMKDHKNKYLKLR